MGLGRKVSMTFDEWKADMSRHSEIRVCEKEGDVRLYVAFNRRAPVRDRGVYTVWSGNECIYTTTRSYDAYRAFRQAVARSRTGMQRRKTS